MRRWLLTLGALGIVQALLVGVWLAVEAGRESARDATAEIRTTPLARPAPDLTLDGGGERLSARFGRPLVLHFWASWCPPCRDELPSLLRFGADTGTAVLAVSLDRDAADVERLLGTRRPANVVLASSESVQRAFDVRDLPVTFIVDAEGTLRLRLDGARDWADPALRALVRKTLVRR